MKPVNLNQLDALVRPAVVGQEYELVELEWLRQQGGWILRLTIDRLPGRGYVSHEDCINVSREVSALLDVHDILPAAYNLEVSSPGVNRPLKTGADFQRFVGQKAKIRLRAEAARLPRNPKEGALPQRNFTGTIDAVTDDVVRLTQEGTSEPVELSVKEMEKANLVYQY